MNNRKYEISMLNEEIDRLFKLIKHNTQKLYDEETKNITIKTTY